MAAPVDEPWWASGAGAGGLDDEDPLDAHRAGRGARHGHRHDRHDRAGHEHGTSVDACQVCPVCAGIRILAEARPELVTHLSEAARHLTLAARAFLDAQADVLRRDEGLQRIDLDDE